MHLRPDDHSRYRFVTWGNIQPRHLTSFGQLRADHSSTTVTSTSYRASTYKCYSSDRPRWCHSSNDPQARWSTTWIASPGLAILVPLDWPPWHFLLPLHPTPVVKTSVQCRLILISPETEYVWNQKKTMPGTDSRSRSLRTISGLPALRYCWLSCITSWCMTQCRIPLERHIRILCGRHFVQIR